MCVRNQGELAEWFWLRGSQNAAVKLSLGCNHFTTQLGLRDPLLSSLTEKSAGFSSSVPGGVSPELLTDWLFASPNVTDEREIEKERMGRRGGGRGDKG